MTAALYIGTIFSWSTTWLAIQLQQGCVACEVSVCYRFAIASCLLLSYCFLKKKSLKFSLRQHGFIAFFAFFNFSLNYIISYYASHHITSGLNALVFSMLLLFNIMNAAIFFKVPFQWQTCLAALIGITGLGLVFLPELQEFNLSNAIIMGMLLSLSSALFTSFGNMISTRNQKNGLPILQTNAIGMGYGAVFSFFLVLATGHPFIIDPSLKYIASLLYLAIVGSIIAFGCYLQLLTRMGPEKAAYPLVIVPIVALILSAFFEEYHWTPLALVGIALIIIGNIILVSLKKPSPSKVTPIVLHQAPTPDQKAA